MSELGRLIDEHRGMQKYPPSYSRIAAQAGVSRQVMSKWRAGTAGLPLAENLHALSRALSVPYQRVLEAALVDAGYYDPIPTKESDGDGQHTASIALDGQAGAIATPSPTVEEMRKAASQQRARKPRSRSRD